MLIDGDFIRRQPQSIQHALTKARIRGLLIAAVPTGSPCQTFICGPTVVVDTANKLIPDVLMQCEPI